MSRFSTLCLLALAAPPLQAQPRIYENGAVNAASFLSPATPGGAIAQGSIFSVFGEDLGPRGLEAQDFPLPTTLGGVQAILITATGDNVLCPLIYVDANQINAILPSAVPAGRHLLRIQRDGVRSNDQHIKVVEATTGLFFTRAQGVPVAVANAVKPFFSRLVSLEVPAGPGDSVVLWSSGLGPVAAPDDQPPPRSASTAQIEVLLAGQSIPYSYAGRSTCCAGLDQINIEIPADAPTGCVVPLAVRVNGNLSNHVSLPITADGSPCDPHLGFRAGRVNLTRQWTGDVSRDQVTASFQQPPGPLDPARLPPEGVCMVWPALPSSARWFDATDFTLPHGSDVGEAIMLTTPTETVSIPRGVAAIVRPPGDPFLGPGAYSASAHGGESFPPFEAQLQVNPAPVLEVLDPNDAYARSFPTNVRWFGGDPAASGIVWSGDVVCRAPIADGQFQIPSYAWANQASGERIFAFGAAQSTELMMPTDGPDHGLLVYREEFLRTGDLGPPHLAATPVTLPSGEKIHAELAATATERARGLMRRPVLDADKGMLFLFETANTYRFWMLNTIIPLDILWLDADRRILFISADTPPCQTQICPTYGPDTPAQYVLEIAAGEAARRGLAVGDQLDW